MLSYVFVEVAAGGEVSGRRHVETHVRGVPDGGQQCAQRGRTLPHAARLGERLVEHLPHILDNFIIITI